MPGDSPPADFCLVCNKIMLENPHTFLMKTGSERSVLSIFRMILATTGTLIITNLTLPLVQFFGDNLSAWTNTNNQ
ncbi:hypothetical protein [Huintestinicola sp.]